MYMYVYVYMYIYIYIYKYIYIYIYIDIYIYLCVCVCVNIVVITEEILKKVSKNEILNLKYKTKVNRKITRANNVCNDDMKNQKGKKEN